MAREGDSPRRLQRSPAATTEPVDELRRGESVAEARLQRCIATNPTPNGVRRCEIG